MLLWKLWKWWRARKALAAAVPAATAAGPRATGRPLPKLFAASLKMLLRDRRTAIWSIAVPVVFAVIFGLQDFGGAQHVKVTTIEPARSAFADRVVAGLRRDPVFRLRADTDVAAAKKRLRDGKTDLVLVVPPHASEPLRALYEPTNQSTDVAIGSVERYVDALNLRLAGVTRPAVRVAQRAVEKKDTNYYDFLLPGLIAMGVMNLAIIGMAIAMTRFREQQVLKRILATPLAPGKFLLAQVGARLALSLAQAAAILAVGAGAFDARVHGNPVWIFVFAALGNLIFLNVGAAIAARAKTVDSAQALAQLVTVPMLFLSGVFFPTNTLPTVLEDVVRALPLTPLVTGMRKIMVDGASITQCGTQLAILAAWVVASFLVARGSFRFGDARRRRFRLREAL